MSTPGDRDDLRDRLLGQATPDPDRLAVYREGVRSMLERNERGLRRERMFVPLIWGFVVFMVVAFSYLGQSRPERPAGVYFGLGLMLSFLSIWGAVELLKHFINRARVEILKEIKGIELRLLEIEGRLEDRAG